jgi:signal transduction histidine kinase/ligand-binding sensor domain-containing protein
MKALTWLKLFSSFFLMALLVIWAPAKVLAQDINFHHITQDQGTGFGNVWGILEDYEGFMWFATDDGLIRYDGYDLVMYRNKKEDPGSISANFVVVLLEDRYNQLWVGTFGGGLNLYDRRTDSFRRFIYNPDDPHSLPSNRVKTMIESQDGNIWLGTEGKGMVIFDPNPEKLDNLTFKRFDHPSLDTSDPEIFMIRSVCEDLAGNIYIGSLSGVTILDNDRKSLVQLRKGDSYPNILSSNLILEVFVDSKQRIWIGTLDEGLQLFLPKQQKVISYYASESDKTLNHPEIETIAEDHNGVIWVGTDNGLSRMNDFKSDIPDNQFTNYVHQSLNGNSLLSNAIKIIYVDSRNALWVGSYSGGINYYNPDLYKFIPIRKKPWATTSLHHNNVTTFAEDKDGNLYVGTDGGGISVLKNANEDIFQDNYYGITIQYSKDYAPETKVKTLKFDHDGNLWIGFWVGGLYSFNPNNKKTKYYGPGDESDSGLAGIRILDLEVDKNNNIWVAAFDQGISYYDRSTGKFKNYLPSTKPNVGVKGERFNALLLDSNGRLWAGGDLGGLNLYNPKTDAFERIESGDILNASISILSLLETENQEICIGTTASGVIIYNPETKEIKNITMESGLPNNMIHSMQQDKSGKIWISTNMGISSINYLLNIVINYSKTNGLQGNLFNNGSSFVTSGELMLFGGTNGWNAFYPDTIQKKRELKTIVFTNFYVNGKLVKVNDAESILKTHLNDQMPISLNFRQRSFAVEFAILDFSFANSNLYAYFLEGFDKEWQQIGTERKAVFTNLNPGNYRLRIMATDHDGFLFEKPEVLSINIVPAWWQTRLFKAAILIIGVIIIYVLYRMRFNFLVTMSRKLEKIVQERTIELKDTNLELQQKNDEIQAQNEELLAQNEQISLQREQLEKAQEELRIMNDQLENIVKQRTEKLENTIRQLDKTVLELDRFVYSASHDLSSPLKSFKGLIEILKHETEPDNIMMCIEHMIKSVGSLEEVIKNLIDYSKNTHSLVEHTSIDFNDLLKEVISELLYWPEAKNIRFDLPEDKSQVIRSDRKRLKIILHNLIGNAIKYADYKKAISFIGFDFKLHNDNFEIRIIDNGIGIDEEHLEKIFEMYYRASEKSTGSGLGLFIVKEAVNKMNGTIRVESVKKEGTTFIFNLPVNENLLKV